MDEIKEQTALQDSSLNPPPLLVEEKKEQSENQGIVYLDGVPYAVGLLWQPLQDPDDPLVEVQETMETDEEFNLYCLRLATSAQYGLAKKSMGHEAGMPALAVSVATALVDSPSVCAVFRVKEGWWFLSIRNDLILSEEDVLFKDENDAKKAFFSMMAVPDWDKKIAPKEWEIDDAETVILSDLVRNVRRSKLQEITPRRTRILIIVVILALFVLGLFIYGMISLWTRLSTDEPISSIVPVQEVKAVVPEPERPKPWEKIVQLRAFFNKCWTDIYQLQAVTIPGWKIGKMVCTPTGLTSSWRKSSGPEGKIALFQRAMEHYQLSKVNVFLNDVGNEASIRVNFEELPTVSSRPNLDAKTLDYDLQDIVQSMNIPLKFEKSTIVLNPEQTDSQKQQVITFYKFSISSPYTPWEWMKFFEKFSGLEILKVEYNPDLSSTENKWFYEGRIYAK